MPPQFYNLKDQAIYSAGDFFIPQEKYRAAPYNVNNPAPDDPANAGIPAIYQAGGGGGFNPYNTDMSKIRQDYNAFPSRQAGEIYSKTFNPQPFTDPNQLGVRNAQIMYNKAAADLADPFNRLAVTQTLTGMRPSKEVMDYYGEKILDNQERYRTQGQYIDPYDPVYSSMTEAQKFMDNYPDYYGVPSGVPEPGIPGAIKSYMQNSLLGKGLGAAKSFIEGILPINERAIMENEARGAGIFTDDIGRIVTDDYNTAGGIMAGYNLNKIDASTFDKRRDRINKTINKKLERGEDVTELRNRLDLLDEAEENILGARKKTQQIYKMRADKRAADKKRKEDEAAAAAAAAAAERNRVAQVQSRLDSGTYVDRDDRGLSASDRAVGGGAKGRAANIDNDKSTGTSQGYTQHYMDGGIVDMLEIYD